jgi:hypothetical protein
MRLGCAAYRRAGSILAVLGPLALGACNYEQQGPPELHFKFFKTGAPVDDTVTVCSAYGCTHQTPFTFTEDDIRHLAILMDEERGEDTPAAERKALGKAIAWIERRVGAATGTDGDRPGLDFFGSGVKSQQDCVDEATNTTSYMLVMERYALLRHHKVVRPMAKGNMILGRWPHWGAMMEEKTTGRKYAVDSFFHANGEPPVIMAASQWYIEDDSPTVIALPPADPDEKRIARPAMAHAEAQEPALGPEDRGRLERLMARVLPPEPGPRASAFGYAADRAR